jgi:signal transduction histidine kinase
VRIEARAVAEVVFLLVDNATKYAPSGTCIKISANRASEETVAIAVEDEGAGIPPHLRERVFDKFFRTRPDHAAALHRPSGIGMGLAIARGIIDAHGGDIWVEDGSGGRGTRAAFTVPIGDEEPSAAMGALKDEIDSRVKDGATEIRQVEGRS